MVDKARLVEVTESAIANLVKTFQADPYFFYTENDLHCHLFNELFHSLPREKWICATLDRKSSVLLHKEYPTKARYVAKKLAPVDSGGARGHFDLSIWNPEETGRRLLRVQKSTDFWREQQTFIAIELDLIEGNRSFDGALHHFRWDLLKLKGNEVENGYQLVFVRNWANKNGFLNQIISYANEASGVSVLYIEATEKDVSVQAVTTKAKAKFGKLM